MSNTRAAEVCGDRGTSGLAAAEAGCDGEGLPAADAADGDAAAEASAEPEGSADKAMADDESPPAFDAAAEAV